MSCVNSKVGWAQNHEPGQGAQLVSGHRNRWSSGSGTHKETNHACLARPGKGGLRKPTSDWGTHVEWTYMLFQIHGQKGGGDMMSEAFFFLARFFIPREGWNQWEKREREIGPSTRKQKVISSLM